MPTIVIHQTAPHLDTDGLSRKYHFNVDSVIRAWQKGRNDLGISLNLNINRLQLEHLRQEVKDFHLRQRGLGNPWGSNRPWSSSTDNHPVNSRDVAESAGLGHSTGPDTPNRQ